MSETLKIRLQIANRLYPMTIRSDQEENLRKAASRIQTQIKKFEENYAVNDTQDVLAMCAIQFAAQAERQPSETYKNDLNLKGEIDTLNNIVEEHLTSLSSSALE